MDTFSGRKEVEKMELDDEAFFYWRKAYCKMICELCLCVLRFFGKIKD